MIKDTYINGVKHQFQYIQLSIESEIEEKIREINETSFGIVIDLETTGLDPFKDKITQIVICPYGETTSYMFPGRYVKSLKCISSDMNLIFHNFKFDCKFLHQNGVNLHETNTIRDTMLIHHLIDENSKHSLDHLVKLYYNDNYKEVFWSNNDSFHNAPLNDQLEYACKDVIYTGMLLSQFEQELEEITELPNGKVFSLVAHIHDFALVKFRSEIKGVRLDLDYLADIGQELKTSIEKLGPEMRKACEIECQNIEFNLYQKEIDKRKSEKGKDSVKFPQFSFTSPNHVKDLLYKELKMPVQYNPRTKNPTTDSSALKELEGRHEVIDKMLAYRKAQKMYTSFIEGVLKHQRNGCIYTEYSINGTTTGRISASKPNIQQMPSQGEWAKIRGIFLPDIDHLWVSCDYAQLEVTIAAHYSQDKNLLKIIYDNISQHDITAEGLGIPRDKAKRINFAMQYGAAAGKVAEILGCSKKEGQIAVDKYWQTYAGLKKLIDECHKKVDRGEPIASLFGRKRHFDLIYNRAKWDKAYRQAFNALIQGTGADIMHMASYKAHNELSKHKLGRLMFEVHDEGDFSVKKNYIEEGRSIIKNTMENIGKDIGLTVPLKVDCSKGLERWSK